MMMKQTDLVNKWNGAGNEVLEAALKSLPQLIPSLKVMRTRLQPEAGAIRADFGVEVMTPAGNKRWLFFKIKAQPAAGLIRETLRLLKAELTKSSQCYPMLASVFIGPRVREVCREEGAGYLDLAGNCYIQLDDYYVEKVVNKNPFPRRGRPASLFTPISSRIVRALLEEPNRRWTVINLSKTTQVSLGQSSKVCRRLLEEGYVIRAQRRIQLTQPGKLLDAWREEYSLAKNTQMAYYSFERTPERLMARIAATAKGEGWFYAVTSFAAASIAAPFVRGIGITTWYVADTTYVDLWVKALDLKPAESGANAVLLLPYDSGVFYRTQVVGDITLVDNIQLYLDLYGNPARGKEQAEFLRKERIGF